MSFVKLTPGHKSSTHKSPDPLTKCWSLHSWDDFNNWRHYYTFWINVKMISLKERPVDIIFNNVGISLIPTGCRKLSEEDQSIGPAALEIIAIAQSGFVKVLHLFCIAAIFFLLLIYSTITMLLEISRFCSMDAFGMWGYLLNSGRQRPWSCYM